ncbi:MAG: oligopeptidase [Subtercola sp.]|nr:oligopeptidase [Subtercola sp.]
MSLADRHDDGRERADLYRDWDAAYVLGSLAPAERLEYEEHLARCPECAASLAELAGMPSLLASISADEAFAIDAAIDAGVGAAPDAELEAVDAPPTLLPVLLSRARSARRRSRLISVGVGVGSVAAAVALTLVVALASWPVAGAGAPGVAGAPAPTSSAVASPGTSAGTSASTSAPSDASLASQLQFVPQVPGPLSAEATLQDEPWGTRIEWKCTWAAGDSTPGAAQPGAAPPTAPASGYHDGLPPSEAPTSGSAAAAAATAAGSGAGSGTVGYGMIVTDRSGASIQVATWTSDPGTVATPTATTSIRLADIASVAIVAADSGQVLLKSTL